ncbi:MAG: hypothetical protein Q7S40_00475 [Opitutaceae bacterium]|nr:hypothetical protein [Opitutaceae bacterium]
MEVWSAMSWTWRALRGHSVTFAALFACGILGLSVVAEFRHLLTRWHAPWYAWFIIPMLAIGYLAKKETQWMPEVETRRKWSRRLFVGSIVIALLLAKFGPSR